MSKKTLAFILLAPAVAMAAAGSFFHLRASLPSISGGQTPQVRIGRAIVEVLVADESEKWWQGLSGHPGLAANEGMLFVFPQKQVRQFWMKEMNFPLDIIWIDGGTIMNIHQDLPPEGIEPVHRYNSQFPVNIVLEVNAGFVNAWNIKIGDKVEYHLPFELTTKP